MKELQRRQKIRQIVYSWPSLALIGLLAFLLAKGAFGVMIKERQSAERLENLEGKSAELNKREAELSAEIARLSTERGVEEEIRDKFSVTKEGEYVAIIVDERRKATTTDMSTGERIRSWWQGLVGWIAD